MPTTLAELIVAVRLQLRETVARFWSDAELLAILKRGARDLWGAYLDLHAEHYLLVDDTHVKAVANQELLTGIPLGCFRIQMIEPLDASAAGLGQGIEFKPRKYNHPDMVAARSLLPGDVSMASTIYYSVSGVGPPVAPMQVRIAPKLTSDLNLRVAYNPTLTFEDFNPVPGESDQALIAWTIAYARAKENESQTPDPGWLSVYATEKQSLLTRSTPRQEQEPEHVIGMFEGLW